MFGETGNAEDLEVAVLEQITACFQPRSGEMVCE